MAMVVPRADRRFLVSYGMLAPQLVLIVSLFAVGLLQHLARYHSFYH